MTHYPNVIQINESDLRPAEKVVKLVTGRNYNDLSENEVYTALQFYYNCISEMHKGNIICPIAAS